MTATSTTPLTFNPLVPPDRDDPFPFYRRSRDEQPLVFAPEIGAWVVTRHADCVAVLADPVTYSSQDTLPPPHVLNPPEVMEVLARVDEPGKLLFSLDPPDHERSRARGQLMFGRRRQHQAVDLVRDTAHQLLDTLDSESTVELSEQFTRPVVRTVLTRLIGAPAADAELLGRYNDNYLLLLSPYAGLEQRVQAAHDVVDYHHYLHELVIDRARFPRHDMTSALVADEFTTVPLPEARMLIRAVFASGYHTTVHAINAAVLSLLRHREHWHASGGDASAAGTAFEEALRRDAPLRGMLRRVTRHTSLAGTQLQPGEKVMPMLGSANRDDTVFPVPDQFRPHRRNSREHLAFGHGTHHCLGAALARLLGRETLHALARRRPHARLPEDFTPGYEPDCFFWGLSTLPLHW